MGALINAQPNLIFIAKKNLTVCNSTFFYQRGLDLSIKYIEKKQFTNQI